MDKTMLSEISPVKDQSDVIYLGHLDRVFQRIKQLFSLHQYLLPLCDLDRSDDAKYLPRSGRRTHVRTYLTGDIIGVAKEVILRMLTRKLGKVFAVVAGGIRRSKIRKALNGRREHRS